MKLPALTGSLIAPLLALALAAPSLAGDQWTPLTTDGLGDRSITSIGFPVVFQGKLYGGTQEFIAPGRLFSSDDGANWSQTAPVGFGNPNNTGLLMGAVFQNQIYVGAENQVEGCGVYRSSDGINWTPVVTGGFSSPTQFITLIGPIFQGRLYATVIDNLFGPSLWSTDDGVQWTQSGANGLGDPTAFVLSPPVVFDGALYTSTLPFIGGPQMYRSMDGVTWSPVGAPGFGQPNFVLYPGAVFNNELYVGAGGPFGGQLWRTADGTTYTQVVADGFGGAAAEIFPTMTFGGELWASTTSMLFEGSAACYKSSDGTTWTQASPMGFGVPATPIATAAVEFQGELLAIGQSFVTGMSIWALRRSPPVGTSYCTSVPNSSGSAATLEASGDPSLSSIGFSLTARDCPPFTTGVFFYGPSRQNVPFSGGTLCVGGPWRRTMGSTQVDANGSATRYVDYRLPTAQAITTGGTGMDYQFWFRDLAAGPRRTNLSDAIEIVHVP